MNGVAPEFVRKCQFGLLLLVGLTGGCQIQPVPCETDSACDDGDPCTLNTCVDGECQDENTCPDEMLLAFKDFVESVTTAEFQDLSAAPDARVSDAAAFEEMRTHVITMYEGAASTGSFELEGQVVDCITIETQPSVRVLGLEPNLDAPDGTDEDARLDGDDPGVGEPASSLLTLGLTDRFGNDVSCTAGSIPMARLELEVLVRYETLPDFFAKGPDGFGVFPSNDKDDGILKDPTPTRQVGPSERRYAYTSQNVTNYGGNSWLNLWSPSLGNTGTMSLSQHWYSAGSGGATQTVEGGWQVLPSKYSTDKSVLFIYWTADNYLSTGCYNLDCPGFVQISSNWFLGGTWSNYSTRGGTQWISEMQWKLYDGNWWLFLRGSGSYEAVGYYPASIFLGGPLADSASSILYGGEVATTQVWPDMGSGEFADQGWQEAAYQRTIFYLPRDENNGVGVWATLTAQEPSSACYTVDLVPASSGGSWGTYFFFGGPGGDPCP